MLVPACMCLLAVGCSHTESRSRLRSDSDLACTPYLHQCLPLPHAAGVILTAMMIPQLWQLWRTRSADDLSHAFLLCYNVGASLESASPACRPHTPAALPWCDPSRCLRFAGICSLALDRCCLTSSVLDTPPAGMLLLVFYNLYLELWVFVVACILQLGELQLPVCLICLACRTARCLRLAAPLAISRCKSWLLLAVPRPSCLSHQPFWRPPDRPSAAHVLPCSSGRPAAGGQGVGGPVAEGAAQA